MKTIVLLALTVMLGSSVAPQGRTSKNFKESDGGQKATGGNMVFIGIIQSVNVTNQTLEVKGQAFLMRTPSTQHNGKQPVAATPLRTLQSIGKEETRRFRVDSFCRIDTAEKKNSGTSFGRATLADLRTGVEMSIEFAEGIGNQYSAKFIQPVAQLDAVKPAAKGKPAGKNN